MGGSQAKPLSTGQVVNIIIDANKKAKLTMVDGVKQYVSNWTNPTGFYVNYDSTSNPLETLSKVFGRIRTKDKMIYNIHINYNGMTPRKDIIEKLEALVSENSDLFPSVSDDTQPAAFLQTDQNDFIDQALFRLRQKGIKIYNKDDAWKITEPEKLDEEFIMKNPFGDYSVMLM